MCFDFLYSFETLLILRKNERDIIKNILLSAREVHSKNTQISTFMKIRPLGADLFHADGQTGVTKLIATFRNFVKAPKSWQYIITGL